MGLHLEKEKLMEIEKDLQMVILKPMVIQMLMGSEKVRLKEILMGLLKEILMG